MHCKFLSDKDFLEGHEVRLLQIVCPNGFMGTIFVTKEAPFSINYPDGIVNTWHYEISADGKSISLTGNGANSIDFRNREGGSHCHETITNWPLIE